MLWDPFDCVTVFNQLTPKCGNTHFLFDWFFFSPKCTQNETLGWKQSYVCWKWSERIRAIAACQTRQQSKCKREARGWEWERREGRINYLAGTYSCISNTLGSQLRIMTMSVTYSESCRRECERGRRGGEVWRKTYLFMKI